MYPAAMNAAVAAAAASRHPVSLAGPQPGQPFKFTVSESCDRMKEEFNFLQAQYHNIKLEADKLVQEKSEMQRHYVMYYEMSYGLNVEMHKQTEIAKRLNAILAQIMPFLSQEVAAAIERAKQVTMTELNAIIGQRNELPRILQQMQAQQAALPHAGHAPPIPLGPHPALPGIPSLPPSSAASLLSGFTGSLVGPANHPLSLLSSKHLLHRDDNTLKEMDHPLMDKNFQSNNKE
ncbi:TLE family member 5-like isoform X5 [Penaeus vannamei]|uniref:TLE family member 5-like isoform X5 n=1 Tax=Penaeus vannamei TaxID=6689 RepID=UPI00387FA952